MLNRSILRFYKSLLLPTAPYCQGTSTVVSCTGLGSDLTSGPALDNLVAGSEVQRMLFNSTWTNEFRMHSISLISSPRRLTVPVACDSYVL